MKWPLDGEKVQCDPWHGQNGTVRRQWQTAVARGDGWNEAKAKKDKRETTPQGVVKSPFLLQHSGKTQRHQDLRRQIQIENSIKEIKKKKQAKFQAAWVTKNDLLPNISLGNFGI